MALKGHIISDFSKAVLEGERLASFNAADRWETVSYETKDVSGVMLNASIENWPQPVTVRPGLSGWHRIYVCMADYGGRGLSNHIGLRLTDDAYFTPMRAGDVQPFVQWHGMEKVEEAFWKAADLSGQDIVIEKLNDGLKYHANILWLRFEPMTEAEAEAYVSRRADPKAKTLLAHMDGDFYGYGRREKPTDFLQALWQMKDSDVGVVSQEIMNDLVDFDWVDPARYPSRGLWDHNRADYMKRFNRMRHEIYREELAFAHAHGMKLIAAQRMALSNFCFPIEQGIFNIPFVAENPQYRCVQRDGRNCSFLSYAYPGVQDFVMEAILDAVRQGFDGAELLFSRGVFLLFEEPLAERFREKYGDGIDFRRLPEKDERLRAVRCEVMNEFIARLRGAMDEIAREQGRERPLLYITGSHTVESGLNIGVDVKTLAERGLIDGVIQSNMSLWEETDDVLAEDGLIDLDKYVRKAEEEYVIKRKFGSDMDYMISGIPAYRRIADETGITLYTELQWENSRSPELFAKAAKDVYAAGSDAIALWDCYPARVQNIGEWSAASQFGDRESVRDLPENPEAYRRIYKILSYNGQDMRLYHPSWRG